MRAPKGGERRRSISTPALRPSGAVRTLGRCTPACAGGYLRPPLRGCAEATALSPGLRQGLFFDRLSGAVRRPRRCPPAYAGGYSSIAPPGLCDSGRGALERPAESRPPRGRGSSRFVAPGAASRANRQPRSVRNVSTTAAAAAQCSAPEGRPDIARGASRGGIVRRPEPQEGRKTEVERHPGLMPFRGCANAPALCPGLRRGLSSIAPPGLCEDHGVVPRLAPGAIARLPLRPAAVRGCHIV